MQQRAAREPIFNAPRVVTVLIGILVAIHIVRYVLPVDTDNWLIGLVALVPARFAGFASELPGGIWTVLTSPFSHMFVHGSIPHLIFNCLWLLAFGTAIALRNGPVRFLLFCALTGLMGAVLFCLLNWGEFIPVVGASGAISGLLGGVTRFLFRAFDYGGIEVLRESPRSIPLMSLQETFSDKRVLALIGIWLAINLLSVVGYSGVESGGGVAWEAHVGGFATGILTYGLFDQQKPKGRKRAPHLRVVH